jgi:hypothetical protein
MMKRVGSQGFADCGGPASFAVSGKAHRQECLCYWGADIKCHGTS